MYIYNSQPSLLFLPHFRSEDELRIELGLHHLTTGKGKVALNGIRPMELFMCRCVEACPLQDMFSCSAVVHESTICLFRPPACIARPGAIRLHADWAVYEG